MENFGHGRPDGQGPTVLSMPLPDVSNSFIAVAALTVNNIKCKINDKKNQQRTGQFYKSLYGNK